MKRVVQHLVFIIGLLMVAAGVQAQVFFSADFSAVSGYNDGPVVGQPAKASQQWEQSDPAISADSLKVENGQLSVIGDGVGGKWIAITIPTQEDLFIAEFDAVYVGDGTMTNIGVCFSDKENFNLDGNPVPTYNEQGAMVRFADNGLIDSRDGDGNGGGTFTKLVDVPYNDGIKFHIRAVIDVWENTVSVYVKKDGEAQEIQIAADYGFRRFTYAVNCIAIFDNNSDRSLPGIGLIFDNVVLSGPTGVSEWALY